MYRSGTVPSTLHGLSDLGHARKTAYGEPTLCVRQCFRHRGFSSEQNMLNPCPHGAFVVILPNSPVTMHNNMVLTLQRRWLSYSAEKFSNLSKMTWVNAQFLLYREDWGGC